MPSASLKHKDERFDSLFRRFKKAVDRDGLIQEVRDREHFEKPSLKRKREKAAAKKRCYREQQAKSVIKKRMF